MTPERERYLLPLRMAFRLTAEARRKPPRKKVESKEVAKEAKREAPIEM
jgi:hypothetical protein